MGDSQSLRNYKNTLPPTPPLSPKIKMKTLSLILCFAIAAAVASPQYGDCKKVKRIKYVEEFEIKCHNEHKQKCTYKRMKVCEKFWKEDGYGGKTWTEDPAKCHYLEESECTQVPHPVKKCNDVWEPVCQEVHKNVPKQQECEVCGGVEKSCKDLKTQNYTG